MGKPMNSFSSRTFCRTFCHTVAALSIALLGVLASPTAFAQGLLLPTDPSLGPLSLASHTVSFEIQDHGAVTHVTQEFDNPTGQMLEATYYFPMPEGAVTTDFALWMNGERIAGILIRKEIIEIIKSGPCDRRQAHRTWFVGR